jgi:16S rRNA processing protein RimM
VAARLTPTPGVTADGWVSIGVIARAHGIKGALKLHFWNEESHVLEAGLSIRVGTVEKRVVRYASGILELEGLSDRNVSEKMQGQEVFVRRDDFPEDDDGGVYLVDLMGAPVVHENGTALGTVQGVSDNGAQPLLMVKLGAREVLVPFVDAIVKEATPDKIVLTPPPGLFDEDAVVDEQRDDE